MLSIWLPLNVLEMNELTGSSSEFTWVCVLTEACITLPNQVHKLYPHENSLQKTLSRHLIFVCVCLTLKIKINLFS